ncbi:MAG: PilN domain-containing protein [Desulfurobacteriaceae bacterium]
MLRFNFANIKPSLAERLLTPEFIIGSLIFTIFMGFNIYSEVSTRSKISEVERKITYLEQQRNVLKTLEKKEKELREVKAELEKKLAVIEKLEKERKIPNYLYFFGNKENVNGIWLEVLASKGKRLSIVGNAEDMGKLHDFLEKLESRLGKTYLKDVKLKTIELKNLNKTIEYQHFLLNVEMENGKTSGNSK